MDLTLVITTYNRSRFLQQLLRDLESQTDPAFQVVVAIDGSTDDTVEVLNRLKPPFDLKWVDTRCPEYGLAVARNRGILAADGDAVVILDDDSVPCARFVAAHKRSVKSRTISGGPRNPSDPRDERMAWKMQELSRLPATTPMLIGKLREDWPNAYLIENNICLLRDDWIDLGLFSERVKMYGFIGQEFFARAEHLGYRYQYNPEAAVIHHGEIEGDNGFLRSRKRRQVVIAAALRPSFQTPRQFQLQRTWALQQAKRYPDACDPPRFPYQAVLSFPYRLLRNAAAGIRRRLATRLR
jgi:glycosyltransferase involved in cell wall biosynthesis